MPPLRERPEEIPSLTELFLGKYCAQYRRPLTNLSPETMALFMQYAWPGNVRELENLVKRIVVLGTEAQVRREITLNPSVGRGGAIRELAAETPALSPASAPCASEAPVATPEILRRSLKEVSREAAREAESKLILSTLERTRWNRKQAAHILGISYKALLYKIKDSGMDHAVSQ